jgi:DNA-3-methyladenine glycosylase
MRERRGRELPRLLCSGPGRLTQALGVNRSHDGLPLDSRPFAFCASSGSFELVAGTRIGISRAVDQRWRFGLAGSLFLSRRFQPA